MGIGAVEVVLAAHAPWDAELLDATQAVIAVPVGRVRVNLRILALGALRVVVCATMLGTHAVQLILSRTISYKVCATPRVKLIYSSGILLKKNAIFLCLSFLSTAVLAVILSTCRAAICQQYWPPNSGISF